jgi:hypothetical protein
MREVVHLRGHDRAHCCVLERRPDATRMAQHDVARETRLGVAIDDMVSERPDPCRDSVCAVTTLDQCRHESRGMLDTGPGCRCQLEPLSVRDGRE